jgi:hypothetical protein
MLRIGAFLAVVVVAMVAPGSASGGIVPSGTVQIPLTGGNGSGRITSSPAGIDCVYSTGNRSGICTFVFTSSSLEPVEVTLTYTPSAGSLVQVARDGSTQPGPVSTKITIADLGMTYSAPEDWTFLLSTPRLTVSTAGSGTGRVVSVSPFIDCGSICSATVDYGTSVALEARPDPGSTFKGWTGVCAGGQPLCIVLMTEPTTVQALFEPAPVDPGVLVGDAVVDVDKPIQWHWLRRADHQARQPRVLELLLTAREPISATLTLRRARVVIAKKSFRAIPIGAAALRLGVLASEKGPAILEGTLTDRNRNRVFVRCRVRIPDVLNAGLSLRRCSAKSALVRRA